MELAIKIFQFVLSISILVLLHELGHFLPARWFRTRAEKFFLFFDPYFSLFSMKKINGRWRFKFLSPNQPDSEKIIVDGKEKEVPIDISKLPEDDWRKHPESTKYGIGWLPLGGYVKIAGMVDESMDTTQLQKPAEPWEFRSKPAWQRLIIMLGGVTVNFFLAWLIYSCLSYFMGETVFEAAKTNIAMHYGEPAKKMGFQDGDKILKVDGKTQKNLDKLSLDVLLSDHVTVLRDGREVTFKTSDEGKALVFQENIPKSFLTPRIAPVADSVYLESASKAGLQQGDVISKINGTPVQYYDEVSPMIQPLAGKTANIEVLRNGTPATLHIPVTADGKIGFAPVKQFDQFVSEKHFSFGEAIGRGLTRTIESLTYQIKQFKLVFNKTVKGYKKVSGPIGIINQMPVKTDKAGHIGIDWPSFWSFTAMFSIWLAFLNLLPIPGLDGGHVMFTLWEMITRKPVSQKVLENAQMIGVIFLMGLMLVIFGNDILKLILGKF